MPKVAFEDTRLDPDLTPFNEFAKGIAKAFSYMAKLALDQRLAHDRRDYPHHSAIRRRLADQSSRFRSRLYATGQVAPVQDATNDSTWDAARSLGVVRGAVAARAAWRFCKPSV